MCKLSHKFPFIPTELSLYCHKMRYKKEFEDLHKFCIDLVNLRKYHHYALLNLNLNWSKHLETQDCESLWQTILNIRTFTKLHEDTNNYLQGLMASFHSITSKLSIESLSESEESFVLYKQEVLFNQLKELSSISEKAGNKFGEIKEIFASLPLLFLNMAVKMKYLG